MTTNTVTTTTPAPEWACLKCLTTYSVGGPELACGAISDHQLCGGTLYQVVDVTVTPAPVVPGNTPGYNCRLAIWFTVTSKGKPRAWYIGSQGYRAFPLPYDKAKLMQATGTAEVLCCHPWKPHTCGKEAGK